LDSIALFPLLLEEYFPYQEIIVQPMLSEDDVQIMEQEMDQVFGLSLLVITLTGGCLIDGGE
jgi:hypothetical protein